jgi:hypothetical protein
MGQLKREGERRRESEGREKGRGEKVVSERGGVREREIKIDTERKGDIVRRKGIRDVFKDKM